MIKAQVGSRNAVMLEVRRDMFVMGVRTGQLRNGGTRPVIVPVQLLITLIDLVAVGLQEAAIEVKRFSNSQVDVALEKDSPLTTAVRGSRRIKTRVLYRTDGNWLGMS
jgi:hypothetical protein